MDIDKHIQTKLQDIKEELNIQKGIIIQEIIGIIINDIIDNKLIYVNKDSIFDISGHEKFEYICKTKYKNYKIKIDNKSNIILFKGYLWWKNVLYIHQLDIRNSQTLFCILENDYKLTKLKRK